MLKKNPAFIVGLPRSGTSIVYRTIQKSPNFLSEKLNLWETKIFMKDIPFDTTDLYYPSLSGYLFGKKEIYDEFLNSVKKYTDKLRRKKKTNQYNIDIKYQGGVFAKCKAFSRNKLVELKWKRSYKSKIIKEYFACAQKYRQSKRMVEKTPHHYMHVHQILWTFPDARIIWMIRHPIDIITSSIKRSKIDENYQNYWNIDTFVKEFRESFTRFDFYRKSFKKNIIMIKYEDFVSETENELKKICTFLAESFSRDSLIIKKNERFNWKPDPYLSSSIVNKTEKNWKDHLAMDEAEKIETALQGLMKKYNFDFYSNIYI